MKKRLLLLLSLLIVAMGSVFAQERTITGTVLSSEDGGPMPGVNITVVGTTTGAMTNVDGIYDKDPNKNPKAKKFDEISILDLEKVIYGETGNSNIRRDQQLWEVVRIPDGAFKRDVIQSYYR